MRVMNPHNVFAMKTCEPVCMCYEAVCVYMRQEPVYCICMGNEFLCERLGSILVGVCNKTLSTLVMILSLSVNVGDVTSYTHYPFIFFPNSNFSHYRSE